MTQGWFKGKISNMINYAVCEINGKQVKVTPNSDILVDFLGDVKALSCDKVLLIKDGEELKIGTPYLKDVLDFDILETKKGAKIRVAKFHTKANYRRVIGSRQKFSKIKLKNSVKKS